MRSWNSLTASRRNVSHHYDLDEALFRACLDTDLHYSCAYFTGLSEPLEAAQKAKCEHIARKLCLRPGQKVMDIGCGWGGLALYLAQHYQVCVTGLTLSVEHEWQNSAPRNLVYRSKSIFSCRITGCLQAATIALFL